MAIGWKYSPNWVTSVLVRLIYETRIYTSFLYQEQRCPILSRPKIATSFRITKKNYNFWQEILSTQMIVPVYPSVFSGTRNSVNHKKIDYVSPIYFLEFCKYVIDANGVFGEIDTYSSTQITLKDDWAGVLSGKLYLGFCGHLNNPNISHVVPNFYDCTLEFEED